MVTRTVTIVVCGSSNTAINNNAISTPKVVDVYDGSNPLPVSSSDYLTFSTFTTTNSDCTILSVSIDNSDLTLSGTNIWRITATVI